MHSILPMPTNVTPRRQVEAERPVPADHSRSRPPSAKNPATITSISTIVILIVITAVAATPASAMFLLIRSR